MSPEDAAVAISLRSTDTASPAEELVPSKLLALPVDVLLVPNRLESDVLESTDEPMDDTLMSAPSAQCVVLFSPAC